MKRIVITVFTGVTLAGTLPLTAQVTETSSETRTETRTETGVTGTAAQSTTETRKSTVTSFDPGVRTKVVQYFDAYKTNPHGLPPEWAARVKVNEVPVAWRTAQVTPGVVITEKERPWLVEAPPELVRVMPPPPPQVRYYLAGGSVVAVNSTNYEVVDSIHIPSVKLDAAPPPVKTQTVVEETTEEVREVKSSPGARRVKDAGEIEEEAEEITEE